MTKAFSTLIWDYLVFLILIITTSVIPLWGQIFGKRQNTKADYVFATQGVSIFAMMLSIARGTLGVRSFLGNCVQINKKVKFKCNIHMWMWIFLFKVFQVNCTTVVQACGRQFME
jgi:hypothetical protein